MQETYKPNTDLQGAAADAMFRAIALYKAAGFTREALENAPRIWWNSTPAAVPEDEQ